MTRKQYEPTVEYTQEEREECGYCRHFIFLKSNLKMCFNLVKARDATLAPLRKRLWRESDKPNPEIN